LSRNALTVLERRYLRKDQNGLVIEKPSDMFRRVADAIADADRNFRDDADTADLSDDVTMALLESSALPR
jgi:ribonucleoside-diphosphate reductase alpha chain